MSEYGRLYEEVSRIRENLKEIKRVTRGGAGLQLSELATFESLIDTYTLREAKASVVTLKALLDALLAKWEQLEKEMEACDDD